MAKRIGRDTIYTEHKPRILSTSAVVGKKEGEGPLREYFDYIYTDTRIREKSWEKAESRMQTDAVKRALKKAALQPDQIDVIFAGDLLNQCIGSTFGLRELNIPFLGQYVKNR